MRDIAVRRASCARSNGLVHKLYTKSKQDLGRMASIRAKALRRRGTQKWRWRRQYLHKGVVKLSALSLCRAASCLRVCGGDSSTVMLARMRPACARNMLKRILKYKIVHIVCMCNSVSRRRCCDEHRRSAGHSELCMAPGAALRRSVAREPCTKTTSDTASQLPMSPFCGLSGQV